MLVRDIMSCPAVTIHIGATLKEASLLIAARDVSAMPVVDGAGHLVGMVTEADLIRHLVVPDQRAHELPVRLASVPFARTVAEVMSRDPVTITPDADVALATELITTADVRSLPVLDHDQVVGVVSRRDVLRVMARSDDLIQTEIQTLFREVHRGWGAAVEGGVVRVEGPTSEPEIKLARALTATVPGVVAMQIQRDQGERIRSDGGTN